MRSTFEGLLADNDWVLADGATGTSYFGLGLGAGDAPERWNVEHPDRVAGVHDSFVGAGSAIILTNSFGANRYRLMLHGLAEEAPALNEAAARIARGVADAAARPVVVAGSMGPTGELFAPLGALSHEDGVAAFAEQARGLAEGGADVLWIETMSSREEVDAALAGAAAVDLPVVCTLSFDTNGRTMMGITPEQFCAHCQAASPPPHAYGTNCGLGAAEAVAGLLNMAASARSGDVLVAKANCGIPEFVDGAIRYSGTPELMARYACLARDAGARIIGGCCGTTAEHVGAMRAALEREARAAPPGLETVTAELGSVSAGAQALRAGETAGPARRRQRTGRRRGP